MQKFNKELLDECVEEGIITNTERFQIDAFSDYKFIKKKKISKNLVDLIQMILLVLMLNGSFGILLSSDNFNNSSIKILISSILVLLNLVCFYQSKKKDNYFYQEVFTLGLWFSIVLIILSINETNAYNYSWIENIFMANVLLIPIIFISSSYITLSLIVISFFLLEIPEVNIVWINIPNAMQFFWIMLIYIFYICFRYRKTVKESMSLNKVVRSYHKYFSDKVACIMLEMMFYILILRLYVIAIGHIDVIFIYIAMIYMLYRRSKTYVDFQYIPQIVDIIYFMYMMIYFYVHEAVNYVPINFILYHTIYYLVFLLLNKIIN